MHLRSFLQTSAGPGRLSALSIRRRDLAAAVFVALCGALSARGLGAHAAPERRNAGQSAPQPTVGTTFKNIQVLTDLKDAPTNDLYQAMQFMAGSLSVSCDYCHASEAGPFDSDVKATKRKAREMIRMTRSINATSFGGRQVVTCNTCHRGSPRPQALPTPWYKTPAEIADYRRSVASSPDGDAGAEREAAGSPGVALPSVSELMERYRRAVGANELQSLRVIGTTAAAMSNRSTRVPFEMDAVFPDRLLVVQDATGGKTESIVNGGRGWRVTRAATRALSPEQIFDIRNRTEALLPVKYAASSTPRTVKGIETIGAKRCYIVEARPASALQELFFDVQTGLLYKVRVEVPTVLGTRVEETTFEDYRTVDGVTLAYTVVRHYMEDQSVWTISRAQVNVAVDPARFSPEGK